MLDTVMKPTEEISVREMFGIDTDMKVKGFAERSNLFLKVLTKRAGVDPVLEVFGGLALAVGPRLVPVVCLQTEKHAEHDDHKIDRDRRPLLFAEMRDDAAQDHEARSGGGRNALIARTALSRTCGAGFFRSCVASFNACSLGYSGSSASSVAR